MTKKLVRPLNDRKIGGVCSALGNYLGISPMIFRFLFLLLLLPGGFPGPTIYILCWIFIPGEKLQTVYYNNGTPFGTTNQPPRNNVGDDYKETIDL